MMLSSANLFAGFVFTLSMPLTKMPFAAEAFSSKIRPIGFVSFTL